MRFLARSLVGLFMLSLTLALLGLAAGSLYSAFQTRMAEGEGAPVARERVFAVRLVDFTPETVTPVLETFGEVRARRTMELRAPLAGRVVELAAGFEDGADVAQGQLLLRMDPADTTAARDLAQSDLDRTVLELREAERAVGLFAEDLAAAEAQAALRASALDRQRDLAGRGVGTDAAIETAELALSSARQSIVSRKQAQAQAEARRAQAGVALDRSRIQLAEAERRLAQTELRAEFAGTLADVSVVVGGILGNNERLGRIIDPEALEVAFRVSTAQFTRLVDEDGALIATPIEVALDVMGTEIYSAGRMTRVSASVGEAATGRLIYISLDAPRGFRPGDFVALRVPEPPLDGLARLPATALDAAGSVLILGPDDRLVAENVDLVRRQGEDVLVRAPQLAGARVVAERGQNLGAGILVRPLGDEAAATPPAAADGQRNGETEGTSTEGAAMVALTPERRAELIAFIEADNAMPDAARARVLAQLSANAVPAQVVARIEARMGG